MAIFASMLAQHPARTGPDIAAQIAQRIAAGSPTVSTGHTVTAPPPPVASHSLPPVEPARTLGALP